MSNNNKTPAIRFKGFIYAWEQRKLGDIVTVYDGVHQTPNYQTSGIMFLSVENIATLKSSHDHHFKWWFEISPIRALLQARPKGRISQANYRLPLKEVIYAYLLAWFLLLVRQYTF